MSANETYPIPMHTALELRNFTHIKQLRNQAKKVSKSTVVPGLADELWPAISFTDFLNQMVGMQQTRNYFVNRDNGSTWMHAETKNGGLNVAYEELPFEWSHPHHYRVERIHSKGPLKYLCFEVELRAANAQETEVTCSIYFVSHLPKAVASLLISKEIQGFLKAFNTLAERLAQGVQGLRVYFDTQPALTQKVNALSAQWSDLEPQERLRNAVADYVLRAPERLAYRLRPYELAALYLLDPLDVLKLCLRLTRAGDFHLMWDCRCPGCKGPKESYKNLQELQNSAYCPSCAVTYSLAFDQNLELTFQPASKIRPTQELYFCAGSPGNTPHISWQQNFMAHESREFQLRMMPGHYVLRSLSCSNEIEIEIALEGSSQLELEITAELKTRSGENTLVLNPESELKIVNQNNYEVCLLLENIFWQAQAVTAAEVQSVHDFHLLFPGEVLSPGERLPLSRQIFLDLKIRNAEEILSHAAPNHEGEAILNENREWAQKIIRDHEGAALLLSAAHIHGLFKTPFDAMSAAWRMLEERDDLNMLYDIPLEWEIGIAAGPCEVYSSETQLAYAGAAVDQARNAAAYSNALGVGITEELLSSSNMEHFIEHPEAELSRSESDKRVILIQKQSMWDMF